VGLNDDKKRREFRAFNPEIVGKFFNSGIGDKNKNKLG
jgi:hypothetical protein